MASITLTGILGATVVIPVMPDIVADLGGGGAAIGLLVGAVSAPGIFVAPIIGVLADRYGRRDVVVPCLLLFGLSGGMASFAPNLGVLLGLRVVQGIGSAGLINLAITIVGDHWHGPERARMIGRNAAVLTGCIVVAPPLGGLLGEWGGWRAAFIPLWLGVVTAIAIAVRLPNTRRRDVTVASQLRAAAPYLRSRTLIGAMVIGGVVFVLIFGLFLAVLPKHLADDYAASPGLRGLAAGAPAIPSTIAALMLGRLSQRFEPRVLAAAALVTFAVAFALIAGVPALPAVFVAAAIYGVGEGLVIPTMQGTAAGVAPEESRGAVVALFVAAIRLGQTIGPIAAAQAMSLVGARPVFAAGAVTALALAASATTLLRRPDPAVAVSDGAAAGQSLRTPNRPQ